MSAWRSYDLGTQPPVIISRMRERRRAAGDGKPWDEFGRIVHISGD